MPNPFATSTAPRNFVQAPLTSAARAAPVASARGVQRNQAGKPASSPRPFGAGLHRLETQP